MGTVATTADSHPANAIFGGKAKPKRGVWNFHGTREGNGRGEGREREEDAPRGQDDSAAGRKGAAAAKWRRRRRSARPTPARWGPRAAAAAAMSLRRRCWLSFWSLLFQLLSRFRFAVRFGLLLESTKAYKQLLSLHRMSAYIPLFYFVLGRTGLWPLDLKILNRQPLDLKTIR
jgi:hypothetical protein